MGAKVQKLENQFAEEKKETGIVSKSSIFDTISIFVNGYTSKAF